MWVRNASLGILIFGVLGCSSREEVEPQGLSLSPWFTGDLPPESSDPPVDTGTRDIAPCLNSMVTSIPEDGDVQVYYRTPITARLQTIDITALLSVEGPEGSVPGESSFLGPEVTFVPTDPLNANSVYTGVLSTTFCEHRFEFTTSLVGDPVTFGSDIEGATFSLDLIGGVWASPASSGPLGVLFGNYELAISVANYDTTSVQWDVGLVRGTEQYPCAPTAVLEGMVWENPYFVSGSEYIGFSLEDFGIEIHGMTVEGAFNPTGVYLQGVRVVGQVDTRNLGDVLGFGGGPQEVCDFLGAYFSISCTACPDGENTCLDIDVYDIPATRVGVNLQPLTEEDIEGRAYCN